MLSRLTAPALALALTGYLSSPASAQIRFIEANSAAGVTDTEETYGTGWADLNGDDYPDIWLGKHQYTPTVIYINQGDGTFAEFIEDHDEPWGLLGISQWDGRMDTHGLGSADFDNDGDVDLLEITGDAWDFPFWVNDGSGRFTNRFPRLGFVYPYDAAICSTKDCLPVGGRGPVWLDYDNDGNLDLMVAARHLSIPAYKQPTAMFRQNVAADGTRTFIYDGATGVNYGNPADCDYGVLAELSGDDNLDLICASVSRIEHVWDTTQLPFVDLLPRLGAAAGTGGLSDLAVGDFNGDLRNDVFAPRGDYGPSAAEIVGDRTVHVQFDATPPEEGGISFLAEGDLVVDFDWSTQVNEVFIGASGKKPPASTDLSVYNGWRNHVQLRLSPNDPANQGLGTGTAGGTYIGRVNGRWQVRFVAPDQSTAVHGSRCRPMSRFPTCARRA